MPLKRDVAIKVSAARFSERFEREAQAIAALNHPNICQIHDVGPNYLVMEFIEGAPLKVLCRWRRASNMPRRSPVRSMRRTRKTLFIAT